jgi:hypothetical protein
MNARPGAECRAEYQLVAGVEHHMMMAKPMAVVISGRTDGGAFAANRLLLIHAAGVEPSRKISVIRPASGYAQHIFPAS